MSKKMKWGLVILIIGLLAGVSYMAVWQYTELQQYKKDAAEADKLLEQRQKQQQTPEGVADGDLDTSHPDFHVHEDGTPHIGTHNEPKVQWTAPEGAVTTPDFPKVDPNEDPVKAAYKRLEYIKNNPYAWGGVHSERATELIAELMPASVPIDHNDGDEMIEQIEELCEQGDPRAAEALIAIMCDGGTIGTPMIDALEAIGPPAVPYLILYLEKDMTEGLDMSIGIYDALGRIGSHYREDLEGILDHIIIPKLKMVAAEEHDEDFVEKRERFGASVIDAQEALDQLQ